MKIFNYLTVSTVLLFPVLLFAQSSGSNNGGGGQNDGGGGFNPGPSGSGGGKITNPLESDSITEFLMTILDVLLTFAIPIIVLMIMYAGFLYVTAGGDEGKVRTAHSALTWSVVGGVIVLAAKLIMSVIQNTVQSL